MKVLQFLCGRAWGGGSVVVLAITRALIARGDDVWVVSFEPENDREFQKAGARLVRPPFWFHPINPTDPFLILYFQRLCRKEKFDLVATHTSKGGFIGRLSARLAGVPNIVHHAHGFSFNRQLGAGSRRFYIFLERLAARSGDLIISVNELQRQMAIEFGVDAPDRICTVHNGIDLRPFLRANRDAARAKLGFNGATPVIGAIGRLEEQKGLVYLIRAFPLILRQTPSAHLVVAGEGPLRMELEREAAKSGAGSQIHFLGFRRDVPEMLAAFDVYVQPSLWEGLSISLIEALAAGKPIVATNIEGNREVVDDGMTGLLVPASDPEATARSVNELLGSPGFARTLGLNARCAAEERFSEERMVEQNLKAYDAVVGRQRHRVPVWGAERMERLR